MKKSYLIIASIATIFASCTETEKLNNDIIVNDAPRVIGFNTISEKATKAVTDIDNLEDYHGTFAVWATKKSNNDANAAPEVVFCGDSIKDIITYNGQNQAPNYWNYSPYRYWDKQATYSFVAVAPNSSLVRYNTPDDVANNEGTFVTTNAAGYTLVGQNLQSSTAPDTIEHRKGFTGGDGKDTDIMTTVQKVTRDGASSITDVDLEFKHILAKLNIAIAKDPTFDNVKVLIKKVEIKGLDDNGSYVETSSTQASGWHSAASANAANYKLAWENTNGIELLKGTGEGNDYKPGKFLYFIESLVMPQTIEQYTKENDAWVKGEYLAIDYTIVSGTNSENVNTENYNYILKLDDGENKVFENFQDRNNYTIFLTVRPNVITFDATTTGWTDKNNNQNIVPPVQP